MKRYINKFFTLISCLILLSACGVSSEYLLSIDEVTKSVALNIDLNVQPSDYQYISGGKQTLIESINASKPIEYQFTHTSMSDHDLYNFQASFESYDSFETFYHNLTGEKLTNNVVSIPFSKDSLLKSSYTIELTDSFDKLTDWLVEALFESGNIDNQHKSKIIKSSNSYISLSGDQAVKGKAISIDKNITIKKVDLDINVKKDGYIDFKFKFVPENTNLEFQDNLSSFINDSFIAKSTNISLENENYIISIRDIDLKDANLVTELSNSLGSSFMNITHSQLEDKKFLKYLMSQDTLIKFNPSNFLSINESIPITTNVLFQDGILHDDFSTFEINQSNSSIKLSSEYTVMRLEPILITTLSIIIVVGVSLFFIFKLKHDVRLRINTCRQLIAMKRNVRKSIKILIIETEKFAYKVRIFNLNPSLSLHNNLLEYDSYALNINKISIIRYHLLWTFKDLAIRYVLSVLVIMMTMKFASRWLSIIVLLCFFVYLIFITIRRQTHILEVHSTC